MIGSRWLTRPLLCRFSKWFPPQWYHCHVEGCDANFVIATKNQDERESVECVGTHFCPWDYLYLVVGLLCRTNLLSNRGTLRPTQLDIAFCIMRPIHGTGVGKIISI